MSQMTKKADDGIMITLPEKNKVDLNVSITMDRLLRNGIDPNQITNPQQVDNAINMINSKLVNRAIPADSDEGRKITEKIFGKQKAPVFDLEGNRIPEGSGIMGGKSLKNLMDSGQVTKGARGMKKSKKVEDREMFEGANKRLKTEAQLKKEIEASNKKGIAGIKINLVDDSIAKIKSMEPIEAMKEANLVAGKKGRYANLDDNQVKKIMDDTQEHIFQDSSPLDDYATGGRAGFMAGGMGRRGFLKMLAGLGAGIGAAKTGLLKFAGKGAGKEVAKEVAQSAGSGTPPPYFFKLAEKIKMLGDDVTPRYATQERQIVKQYKDYELTEDIGTGKIEISKKNIPEGDEAVDYFGEPLMEDVYMSYKPGEMVEGAGGKVLKSADEYIEDTAYVRTSGRQTGDISSEIDGITEETLKKIIKDIDETPSIKKASGGIARMLGE